MPFWRVPCIRNALLVLHVCQRSSHHVHASRPAYHSEQRWSLAQSGLIHSNARDSLFGLATGVCEISTPFVQALALQSNSRNCSPDPDLVFSKLIVSRVFFSGPQTPVSQGAHLQGSKQNRIRAQAKSAEHVKLITHAAAALNRTQHQISNSWGSQAER